MRSGQRVHYAAPHSSPPPANEAVVAGGVRTEVIGQVAPWCSGSQHPEDAIEDTPVVHPWHTARLVWQHRPDGCPFVVGEFVAHDSSPRFRGLNHDPKAALNGTSICRHWCPRSLFGAKRTCEWFANGKLHDSVGGRLTRGRAMSAMGRFAYSAGGADM